MHELKFVRTENTEMLKVQKEQNSHLKQAIIDRENEITVLLQKNRKLKKKRNTTQPIIKKCANSTKSSKIN